MNVILLQLRVVLQHIGNQWINVLTNIMDLRVDIMQSSIILRNALVFCQLLLLFWFNRSLDTGYCHGFWSNFNVEVNWVCELVKLCFDPMLSDHVTNYRLCHFFIDVQKFTDLLEWNVEVDLGKNHDIMFK